MVKYIEWHFTNACNLKCLHCMCNSGNEKVNIKESQKHSLEFIKMIKPECVNMTGGEPLLSHDIFNIAQIMTNNNITLTLSTNGTCKNNVEIRDILKYFKGGIQFSLDSPSPQIHDYLRGVKGAYEDTINFIDCLRSYDSGYDIQLCMCLNKYNYKDICEYEDILNKYSINSFKVLSMYDIGRASENHDIFIDEFELQKMVEEFEKLKKRVRKTKIYYSNPEAYFEYLKRKGQIKEIDLLNIDAEGNIRITPYLPYQFGNVREFVNLNQFQIKERDIIKQIRD